MPRPKPLLDPPFPPDAPPALSANARPRLSKRPLRLAPKHAPLPNPFPDPSSGLLALLVTVAGSSPVDGRPLDSDIPPDFLCPRLHLSPTHSPSASQDTPAWYWGPCDDPQSSSASKLAVTSEFLVTQERAARPRRRRVPRNDIADKYEQSEEDGRWRKADSWELYGSSSCAVRLPSRSLSPCIA